MFANGKIVEVYEDPLTMERKEGNARIIKHVLEFEPGVDQYEVNFIGDDIQTVVVRTIAEDPIAPDFALASLMSTFDGETAEVIAARYGEQGYHRTNYGRQTIDWVVEQNERFGVDEATALAFSVCSLTGRWGSYKMILAGIREKRTKTSRCCCCNPIHPGDNENCLVHGERS